MNVDLLYSSTGRQYTPGYRVNFFGWARTGWETLSAVIVGCDIRPFEDVSYLELGSLTSIGANYEIINTCRFIPEKGDYLREMQRNRGVPGISQGVREREGRRLTDNRYDCRIVSGEWTCCSCSAPGTVSPLIQEPQFLCENTGSNGFIPRQVSQGQYSPPRQRASCQPLPGECHTGLRQR